MEVPMHSLALEDWFIVAVMVLAVLGGLQQGFFRSVCSLCGLILGLAVAAWNYAWAAALLMPLVREQEVANAIGFIAIALLVMGIAGIIGTILHKFFRRIGLGCLDRLLGAAFGFFQGALLVTLAILVAVAFFPEARWLTEARLPRLFFGACHLSASMSPSELSARVHKGLKMLEEQSPQWMHPGTQTQ
jgi:membrane protein required for colicin V production